MTNKIDTQIEDLKVIFETESIIDKCSKPGLTDNEIDDIIQVIKTNKKDGEYEISDDIKIKLNKGDVVILDND